MFLFLKELKVKNFTGFETALWAVSMTVVTASFVIGGNFKALTLIASLIGVTALIFVAKGDVTGQVLTVIFSVLYSIISFQFTYYGEMITYMFMTAPIAVISVFTWIRHPEEKGRREVSIARLDRKKTVTLCIAAVTVTVIFYFILKYFNNANLFFSTISITTSFLASALTMLRSSAYALAYGANDVILIVLWVMASFENTAYLPMVMCFVMFFVNDMYGFYSWQKRKKLQEEKRLCSEK